MSYLDLDGDKKSRPCRKTSQKNHDPVYVYFLTFYGDVVAN